MEDKLLKATSNSALYTGGIKMTLKKGNKAFKVIKQHNSGTVEFFKYILNVVKGSILPNNRPSHIKLIYEDGVSKYGVIYESVTDAIDTGTSERAKATITYKFLIPETIVHTGNIVGLQLESSTGVIYATVDLDPAVNVKDNTNIELEWNLSISD